MTNQHKVHVFGWWEETHADSGGTYKLHTERHRVDPGTRTRVLLADSATHHTTVPPQIPIIFISISVTTVRTEVGNLN